MMILINEQNGKSMFKPLILRPAVAMIELIFAIVVIGITLLSAPLVLNQSIQSSTVALQQESISAAATQLSLIMTQNWDESDNNLTSDYGIRNVVGGDSALNNGTRDLNLSFSTRRYATALGLTNATLPADLGLEPQDLNRTDDIDDFTTINGMGTTLRLYPTEGENLTNNKGEYIDKTIIMNTIVRYGNDTPISGYAANKVELNNPFTLAVATTNIKLITVTLTSASNQSEHNKSIVMSAFSCNIGISVPNVNGMN